MRQISLAVFALAAGCTASEATQPSPSGPLPVTSITIEGPADESAGLCGAAGRSARYCWSTHIAPACQLRIVRSRHRIR